MSLDRLIPDSPNLFINYAAASASADMIDDVRRLYGEAVAQEVIRLRSPLSQRARLQLLKEGSFVTGAVKADPEGKSISFFSDTIRGTILEQLSGPRSIAGALDLVGSAISSLLDPSEDPVSKVEALVAGGIGGIGAVAAKRAGGQAAKKAGSAISEAMQGTMDEAIAARLKAAQNQLADAQNRLTSLKQQLASLKQTGASQDDIDQVKKQINRTHREIAKLKLQTDPASAQAEIDTMGQTIADLKNQLQQTTDPAAQQSLRQQIETLTKRMNRKQQRLERAKAEMLPVHPDDVTEVLHSFRSMVESARLGDELRKDIARGLIVGKEDLLNKADALEDQAKKMVAMAQAVGLTSKDIAEKLDPIQKGIDRLKQVAQVVGDKRVSLQSILTRDIEAIPGAVEKTAEDIIFMGMTKKFDDLSRQLITAPVEKQIEAQHALMKQFKTLASVAAMIRRSEVKIGQLERISGFRSIDPTSSGAVMADTLMETIQRLPEGATPLTLAAQWLSLRTSRQKEAYLAALTHRKGSIQGSLEDIYLNALISSPATPAWNIISMSTFLPVKIAERAIMARFDDTVAAPGEATVMAQSFVNSFFKLFAADGELARKKLRSELERAAKVFDPDTLDERTAAKLGIPTAHGSIFRAAGQYGRAVDVLGYAINAPRFVVASTDSVFRYAIKEAVAEATAYRQAYLEAKDLMREGAQLSKDQITKLINDRKMELLSNPNATVVYKGNRIKITDIAEQEANIIAMMDDLHSPLGQKAEEIMRSSLIGRLVMPFFRVSAITARETITRAGPAALLLPSVRRDLEAGGARAVEAKAKMATGMMLAAMGATLWGAGVITDGGPIDPELNKTWKAAGHEPYTLRLGDTKIPLSRLGVVGQVLMYTADMSRALSALPSTIEIRANDPNSTLEKVMVEGAAKLTALHTALVGNEVLFNDLQRIMRAIATGDGAALQTIAEQRLGAMVPFSALNKDIREYLDKERTSTDGFLSTLVRNLPFGHAEGMSTMRNGWGDKTADFEGLSPVEVFLGFTSDAAPRKEIKRRVAEELVRSEVAVQGPSRVVQYSTGVVDDPRADVVSVTLTMAEWNKLKEAFGKIKIGGLHVDERLDQLIRSEAWRQGIGGSGGSRDLLADMIVEPYRKAAREWLISGQPAPALGINEVSPFAKDIQARIVQAARQRVQFNNAPQTQSGSSPRVEVLQ